MLEIRDLNASIGDKPILKGIDLTVPQGEIHAIMGPNGSGKSTLGYVLSGREDYEVTGGSVTFKGVNLLDMEPEQRAAAGLFLAFQAPIELPGVNNANFLRTALNAIRRAHGEPELDAVQFLKLARAEAKRLAMPDDMLKRNVNVGFSGGEKKRNEVLQMAILRPKLAILDETDSGLDIDALKIVADGVNALRGPEFSALVITHHQRLLDYLVPTRVHVLAHGRIIRSGGPELAKELEKSGYANLVQEAARRTTDFLSRYEAQVSRLPGDLALRAAAASAFREAGLPGGRNQRRPEAWKYTSLRAVAEATFQPTPRHEVETLLSAFPLLDTPRLVFADGMLHADLSVMPPTGFSRFAEQPDFGTLTWPDREPMVALNTMLATDGASIHVPAGHDGGILQLVALATGDGDHHPRHSIRLDKGARLTLLEISAGQGAYLLNTVAEIHVAEGAHLTHVRLQDEAVTAFHVSTTYVDIQTGGTYDSFTLNLGARLARTEVHAQLSGPGAIAHLNAAQILAGSQHSDFTTVVGHSAPNGTSRQTVKNVLAGRSRGVFQGKIEVARHAQKTDGYQMNQALLLSPYAEVDSKPELEIFADDVKCSHGATIGELDAEQMFYLRSRGIPDAEARSILVRAFLAEALDAVTDETIRARLETAVEQWWERQKV